MTRASLLWMALVAVGCGTSPRDGACQDCNVVMVMVDTLRADHLGIYGYERDTSPNIDTFARSGIVFSEARSQAACTFPSVNSLLTSRYPALFMDQPERDGVKDIGIPTTMDSLAEVLQREGYQTVAISGSPIVRDAATPSHHNKLGGFERGFDVFETLDCEGEDCTWKSKPHAAQLNERAAAHLDTFAGSGAPFFLYLHYMDVHDPYAPPQSAPRKFSAGRESTKEWVRAGNPNPIARSLLRRPEPVEYDDEDLEYLVALYDDEILYFDAMFAELLTSLSKRGLLEKTIVVLVSDHGEGFLEHGTMKHCRTLFDTEIRTPLLLRVPDIAASGFRKSPVGNIDVMPTLLDYLGVTQDDSAMDGRSLRPVIERTAVPSRASYSAQHHLRSLFDGQWKLIFDLRTKSAELYDLSVDPLERRDQAEKAGSATAALQERLLSVMAEAEEGGNLERAAEIGRETQEHLKAIGYLQ